MGQGESKPSPPQPFTDVPWRNPSDWDAQLERSLISQIQELNPKKRPNLLTVGPVGAGKSSFINSILSIGKTRKCSLAATGSSTSSYTVVFEAFTEESLLKKYHLMDCMGIEQTEGHGFHPDDIIAILKGHIRKGYTFNPAKPISEGDKNWKRNPKIEDQIHCVIFVVDARTIHAGIPSAYLKKIEQLQEKIKRADIRRVLVLTKADLLCDEVRKDIRKMFWSKRVRDAVKISSEVFGIDQASIHPVVNYEVDFELNPFSSIPLLLAVRQAMHYAEDRVDRVLDSDSSKCNLC